MKAIENLLRERIGLDAASIGVSLIERCVRLRMKALGLREAHEYLRRVRESEAEWRELIESVVVPETWFFRDRQAFEALVQVVLSEWLPCHPLQTLRILSSPCSTGEEPFSLAMALLDASLPAERFVVHGVDISERALGVAANAVYGRNAFRGQDLAFRDRHFHQVRDGYALAPRVRERVRFFEVNLLEDDLPGGTEPYDFIFCRNLLIYFDRPTQARLLQRLRSQLALSGLLFVGPAELPLVVDQGFVQLQLSMAFACRRDDAEPASALGGARRLVEPREMPVLTPPPVAAHGAAPQPRVDTIPAPTHMAPPAPRDLAEARRLADAGKLAEARAVCEAHLKSAPPAAEAYYLLGLIADAGGEPGALEFYRRALYLDPDHYESLLQLAFLLEKQGDETQARSFRRRAERARREVAS